MLANNIKTKGVNGSWLAEQRPVSLAVILETLPTLSREKKSSNQENNMVTKYYILKKSKARGCEGMFSVSEKCLVGQVNTFCRNWWMTEIEREELERKSVEFSAGKKSW